jgi:hypothetical protein
MSHRGHGGPEPRPQSKNRMFGSVRSVSELRALCGKKIFANLCSLRVLALNLNDLLGSDVILTNRLAGDGSPYLRCPFDS